VDAFIGNWKADAILGLERDDIMMAVPVENGLKLWGFLNTARRSTAAAGAGVVVAPDSPRLASSIFVLCSIDSLGIISAIGTVFIVSKNCVATAYHNIKNTKETYYIIGGLERHHGNVIPIDAGAEIGVKYHHGSPKDDWALLMRFDNLEFDRKNVISISNRVPNHSEEAKLKIYHCPISLFNNGMMDAVMCTSVDARIAFCTGHKVFSQIALFSGSSGGLFALYDGTAIGMHVESLTETVSFETVSETVPVWEDAMEAVSNSCVEAAGAFSEALLLPKFRKLLNWIELSEQLP